MGNLLSVIIPAYNEEGMVEKSAETIVNILEQAGILYEIIYVNDGSDDTTWEKINLVERRNDCVKGICFSRNFGKEAAMFAGMSYSKGDCCVIMDCDLQQPPEMIVEMYQLWEDGYEVVEAVKADRGKENSIHTVAVKCFYYIISKVTDMDMSRASDFKLMDRKAVNALLNMHEKNTFFRALSSWIGFRSTQIEFCVQERTVGKSKWSTAALIKYAVSNISSFSSAPLFIVMLLGAVMLGLSIVLGCMSLYDKLIGVAPEGFTTVIIIQLFIGSMVMISLGIIGYYISKIYEEVKDRPQYIVTETCGNSDGNDLRKWRGEWECCSRKKF